MDSKVWDEPPSTSVFFFLNALYSAYNIQSKSENCPGDGSGSEFRFKYYPLHLHKREPLSGLKGENRCRDVISVLRKSYSFSTQRATLPRSFWAPLITPPPHTHTRSQWTCPAWSWVRQMWEVCSFLRLKLKCKVFRRLQTGKQKRCGATWERRFSCLKMHGSLKVFLGKRKHF